MTLADVLLGRREPRRARSDLVGGIVAARLALELDLEVRAAAIAFEPPAAAGFDALLASVAEDAGVEVERHGDAFGLRWVTLAGAGVDDLALCIGVLAESFERAGRWEQVASAVFAFRNEPAGPGFYWVYNFERGTFYAFVPRGGARRDAGEEARLEAAVRHDLRLEDDPQRRYPLWGLPV